MEGEWGQGTGGGGDTADDIKGRGIRSTVDRMSDGNDPWTLQCNNQLKMTGGD